MKLLLGICIVSVILWGVSSKGAGNNSCELTYKIHGTIDNKTNICTIPPGSKCESLDQALQKFCSNL